MSQPAAQLAATIRSERAGVQALVETLTAERNALLNGLTDQLAETAQRKRELLLHIAHLGDQRNRVLERSGFAADRRGMENWLVANDPSGVARTEWNALLELTRGAHRLNRENGAYIDAGMRANQHALQALMSASAAASTYGASGRATNPYASRSLASA
ncbi:MAG TPA: flagellar protein FlgN [Burkholderiales bacterium]|nr:flagellar protein FlgN [Burkholderiales bacterium]